MNRIIPRSADAELPILVVLSYDRAGRVSTIGQDAFSDLTKVLVVHNEEERDAYELFQDLNGASLVASGVRSGYPGSGKARQMQWVWDQLDEGEMVIFADDDITKATHVPEPWSDWDNIDMEDPHQIPNGTSWGKVYATPVDAVAFRKLLSNVAQRMHQQNTILGGFASNGNHFFRTKHWRKVGFIVGHLTVMRKDNRFAFDPNIMLDDYRNVAEIVTKWGSVVIDNYAYFDHGMYQDGGLGPAEGRIEHREDDVRVLMEQYPRFFRIKNTGVMAGVDLSINIQDRTLEAYAEQERVALGKGWL